MTSFYIKAYTCIMSIYRFGYFPFWSRGRDLTSRLTSGFRWYIAELYGLSQIFDVDQLDVGKCISIICNDKSNVIGATKIIEALYHLAHLDKNPLISLV